ncbi:MAG: NAD(P)H-hydrate dehydratase [Aeoliella sp.]
MREESTEPLPALTPRKTDSHKGDYGRMLLVGGSRGMAGAISLTGLAALRSGAGLVTIATPRCVQQTVASFSPAYMTVGLADDDDTFAKSAIEPVMDLAEKADVVAIGPGMGRTSAVRALVLKLYTELDRPMVVDADSLNAIGDQRDAIITPGGARILTPHPGEFARLAVESKILTGASRATAAVELASCDESSQTIVVLKGNDTVIAMADRYAINTTGNPGMASGGAGDVLTGVIAAIVAQDLDIWSAARLGVYVHGLAGDLAAKELGQVSVIATDLIDFLPAAFQRCAN